MKDGWHIVKGFNVYVENNCIIYGVSENHEKTLYPYKDIFRLKGGCSGWVNVSPIKVDTFRKSKYYTMK